MIGTPAPLGSCEWCGRGPVTGNLCATCAARPDVVAYPGYYPPMEDETHPKPVPAAVGRDVPEDREIARTEQILLRSLSQDAAHYERLTPELRLLVRWAQARAVADLRAWGKHGIVDHALATYREVRGGS